MNQDTTNDIHNNRYLCFNLGKDEYAIPLLSVREVIALPEITKIPQTPAYFLGITNLRGQIISILDLRNKLGLKTSDTKETSVIICDFGAFCLGTVVDSINRVLAPENGAVDNRPTAEGTKGLDHVVGVIRNEDKLILKLDLEKALSSQDIVFAKDLAKRPA